MIVKIEKIKPAFTDERGDIIDVWNGESHNIGLLTFTPGSVRGNHYHKEQTQWSYMLHGTLELHVRPADDENAAVEMHILEEGTLVTIPPNVIHAYRTDKAATMLCFTSKSRAGTGFEDDTYRVKII
jgi:quercetin dioxygenase-like cupin family protein